MGQIIIGVMGPGAGASPQEMETAYALGQRIAECGWVTLTGGRDCGVMDAACRGAKSVGGMTVGILPTDNKEAASSSLDIVIPTGMGSARNNINILASDVIVACGMGAGTASEVALAIKAQKSVVLLQSAMKAQEFFLSLDAEQVRIASTVNETVEQIAEILSYLA
ncbi:MAG: hypothetical protein WCD18_18330 [Thermosynechococcaceae cyanobacterium]